VCQLCALPPPLLLLLTKMPMTPLLLLIAQGDGTAAIFAGDPSVFTLSLHCEAQPFPHTPVPSDLDVGLPAGTTDEQYMQVGAVAGGG